VFCVRFKSYSVYFMNTAVFLIDSSVARHFSALKTISIKKIYDVSLILHSYRRVRISLSHCMPVVETCLNTSQPLMPQSSQLVSTSTHLENSHLNIHLSWFMKISSKPCFNSRSSPCVFSVSFLSIECLKLRLHQLLASFSRH